MTIAASIPGEIRLAPAKFNDYKTLARFHYLQQPPATCADVVGAWHHLPPTPDGQPRPPRCIGVAVLSWPTACSLGRQRALSMGDWTYGERLRFANANLRCISRVIVHPTYRALGLASQLIRLLIARCHTRYVETSAMMAHAHPLFERAGMRRFDLGDDRPVY